MNDKPMGWGRPEMSRDDRFNSEQRAFGEFAQNRPEAVMRQAPRQVVNTQLLDSIAMSMREDGIEDGFDFMYLEAAIFGKPLDYLPQLIGSCVASGGRIVDTGRLLAEVFLFNEAQDMFGEEFQGPDSFQPFAPFNYRAGRKFAGINGGSASGRDDGSLCAPHYRGKTEYGFLTCGMVDSSYTDAWPEPQREATYRQWGADDTLLNRYKSDVFAFLEESEKVTDDDSLMSLLVDHKKPMQVCSMWAFEASRETLDIGGSRIPIYQRSREEWAHNMSIVACWQVNGKWYAKVRNTWGKTHSGNDYFIIPMEVMASWLRDAEVMTTGNINMQGQDTSPI